MSSWVATQTKRKVEMLRSMLVLVIIQSTASSPLRFAKERELENNRAIHYLTRYGYIRNPTSDSKKDLKLGLKRFQEFFKLPVTEILDEATLELMSKPRCGVSDNVINRNRYLVGSPGIDSNPITYFVTNSHPNLQPHRVNQAVEHSMELWCNAGKMSCAKSNASAIILITFSQRDHNDGEPFDGSGGVLAHAAFPNDLADSSDIHCDNDENWSTGPEKSTTIDFYSVILHEEGHSLGLAHSDVEEAIMFPIYQYYDKRRPLHDDDVKGILAIYGNN